MQAGFHLTTQQEFTIESFGKIKYITIIEENEKAKLIKVGMGSPELATKKIPAIYDSETIIVIECKPSIAEHSIFPNVEEYENYGYGSPTETENYAINGALWYASFLKSDYDVVAIGVSGQNTTECRVTSYVWPKDGEYSDIKLLEDGHITDSLVSIMQYEKDINVALNRFAATENAVRKELRRYTLSCANFLRSNGIEDNSKAISSTG